MRTGEKAVGLTESSIREIAEARFASYGIRVAYDHSFRFVDDIHRIEVCPNKCSPGDCVRYYDKQLWDDFHFLINVMVVGQAFSISVELKRGVRYYCPNKSTKNVCTSLVTVASKRVLGTHGQRGGNYILNSLDSLFRDFVTQYVLANKDRMAPSAAPEPAGPIKGLSPQPAPQQKAVKVRD